MDSIFIIFIRIHSSFFSNSIVFYWIILAAFWPEALRLRDNLYHDQLNLVVGFDGRRGNSQNTLQAVV